MKISGATIAKYAGATVHYLGPTVILGIIAIFGFGILSARLESQQEKLYETTQNQVAQFRKIADGIAQAKTRIVEKRTLQKTVKELPPEVRAELKDLKAKVAALLSTTIQVPAVEGSGNATHKTPLSWHFSEPDILTIDFTLKKPSGANSVDLSGYNGAFDYKIEPIPIKIDVVKGVYSHDGVDGLQQWFITAKDDRSGKPLAVQDFNVRIPNMFVKKHWWQHWYIKGPAWMLLGMQVAK